MRLLQWLLEIDPHVLREKALPKQQYWLLAVDAAREAGERALDLSKGATSSWKSILKDGRFVKIAKLLPTSTLKPGKLYPVVQLPAGHAMQVAPSLHNHRRRHRRHRHHRHRHHHNHHQYPRACCTRRSST